MDGNESSLLWIGSNRVDEERLWELPNGSESYSQCWRLPQ